MSVRRRWRFRPPQRASAEELLAAMPEVPGGRVRETRRLQVPCEDVGVKVFHHRGAAAGRRARREWRVASTLADLGLPAAEPVALCESPAADYYFFRWKAERVDLQAAVLGGLLAPDRRRRLSAELGTLLRRLHDAGFVHRDFHAANVLVDPGGAHLSELVDFHRCRRLPWLAAAQRRRDLLAFSHFFFRRARAPERLRFLKAYGGPFWPEERTTRHRRLEELGRASARSFHRFLCRQERRCLGAGRAFRRLEGGDVRGVVEAGSGALRALEDFALHAAAAPPRAPARVVVPGLGTVLLQEFPGTAAPGGGARHAWLSRHRLRMAGVATPRPLLFLEGRSPRRTPGFLFTREDDAPPRPRLLAEVLREEPPAVAHAALDRLAGELAQVHDEFLSVPGLTAEKFLVDPASGALTWLATDARRVPVHDGERLADDVRALLESLPDGAGGQRFVQRYLRSRANRTAPALRPRPAPPS